ncbi:MAG: potassium channel family protein [Cetobacterium sp.]|uniref:potassium channel family protein n=1 Tax=Cetobacterium sp. TaxID=2071632 RepID=UPI003F33CC07
MRLYRKKQILILLYNSYLTGVISILVSLIAYIILREQLKPSVIFFTAIKIFFSVLPIVFLKRRNFLFKDGPLKSVILILYYLILVPIVNFSLGLNITDNLKYFFDFLSIIDVILLISSHIILLKYVVNDFFRRKRKIVASDVTVVMTTYITLAISFGLLYTLLSLFSVEPVFHGINRDIPGFEFYFKHIYFSFITITTIGYGDIYPLKSIAQFFVVLEIITGIILTNVILGLVIGSGILKSKDQ